ncbi:uncharacterized mitochondrial protein AtMg00860-like [Arachis duranensis]|uniref:Uncharacterized mitochondrial protein AtMg00860-like n=1 Tax=Arachis duranensis TaxID=130453 RepID=A0A6P4DIU0_ARADU|nr:uncharacterized mitochondrial protein AtMg00860-like [Arachis duranensis]
MAAEHYLGHVVSRHGVQVDGSKVTAIREWPVPTSVKQLRALLGIASYYRKFICQFATLATPLTDLLKKDAFIWSAATNDAFINLKYALTTTPVLALPNFSEPFVLETDASGIGLGAILS